MSEEIIKVNGEVKKFINMKCDPETGELMQDEDVAMDDYEAFEMNKKAKQENMIKYYKVLDGKAAVIDAEMARLAELKRITLNKQTSIKWFLTQTMLSDDDKKIDFDTCSASRRKTAGSLEILPEADLQLYTNVVPVEKVDKKAIREALKKGVEIKGCKIVPGETLIIK